MDRGTAGQSGRRAEVLSLKHPKLFLVVMLVFLLGVTLVIHALFMAQLFLEPIMPFWLPLGMVVAGGIGMIYGGLLE